MLDGKPAPLKGRGATFPQCWPIYCGNMAAWIKMPLGMEVGFGPGHIVLDADQPQRGTAPPQFSAHVCCGQTTGWIRMSYGMEVALGPGHCVRWGAAPPPEKGKSTPPLFGPCLLWPSGRPSQLLLSCCSFYRTQAKFCLVFSVVCYFFLFHYFICGSGCEVW